MKINQLKHYRYDRILVTSLYCLVCLLAVSFSEARTLRGYSSHPNDYPVVIGMQNFADRVHELTQGKYTLRVFPSGTLGAQDSVIDQFRFGAVDWAVFNLAPLSETVELLKVLNMPYVFRSPEHMYRVMDGKIGAEINQEVAKYGFVSLGWYGSGSRSFYNRQKPIVTPADMIGMKIRVQNSAVAVAMVEALGARATPIPYSEVYTAIKTGVVDGAENNWPSYESQAHHEVAPYYSLDRHMVIPEMLCVSEKLWNRLSQKEKEIFQNAARDSVQVMRKAWDERVEKSIELVTKEGAKINEVNLDSFVAAMQPVWQKLLNTQELGLINRIQAIE